MSVTVISPLNLVDEPTGERMRPFGTRRLVEMLSAETCHRRATATIKRVATIAGWCCWRLGEYPISAIAIGTKRFEVVRNEGLPNVITQKPIGRHWRRHFGRQM